MKWKCTSAVLILTAAVLVSFDLKDAAAPTTGFGPRSDLQIFYYANEAALYSALKQGEIDVSFWEITPAQYQDAVTDPNILLMSVPRLDFRAFTLNNNQTISYYPGVKNPLSIPEFRKALHRLSNVDYYVNTINKGFAVKLPVTIAAPSSGWLNMSVVDFVEGRAVGRYPYPYDSLTFNREAAKALLDIAGFTDIDGDGIRNYPANWPGRLSRPNLDRIRFRISSYEPLRKQAGQNLAAEMESAGIPVDEIPDPWTQLYIPEDMRNYHIYTAGWSVGRFPTYLYSWFHSSKWYHRGPNYFLSPYGQGGIPDQSLIDETVLKVWYPSGYSDATKAAKDAQYLLTEKNTVMIPLWSSRSFHPYRNDLLGVTNYQSTGPENDYTYLKAWKPNGGTIRAGIKSPPLEINQIYSRWFWDVQTLNPFMADFISAAPYNIMVDQPWLTQDMSQPPDTWLDAGVEKSKMTYWFRDDQDDGLGDHDAEWIEPVTGNVLDDFTPEWLEGGGYEFNSWYYASEPAGWIYGGYRDTHHIRIYPAERKAEVYFNVKSYWSMYWPYGRLLYAPSWKQSPVTTLETRVFNGPIVGGASLPLPYRTAGAPVEIVEILRSDGITMKKASGADDNDYEMVSGKIKLYTDVPSGVSITVKYWARGDPSGYAPGNLHVQNTNVGKLWVGTGLFYVTEHVPGAGGWTTYKRNPHFFLETPPRGEIDFWWHWANEAQPRRGYYRVDIVDIVKSTWALDSRGYGGPSPNWDSGADLTQEVKKGLVTVHDITLMASDFGETMGSPPESSP